MISIITITYNNYEELVKTLSSIPKSDLVESVVINGGECEKTKEYLKHYGGKSLTEKDDGIADAFNKGIKISSGKHIMFLNSGDTLLEKSYPEKAIKILENNIEYDFTHSNLLFIDSIGAELFMKPPLCNLGRGMPFLHLTMVVRKTVFDQIGLFNKDYNIAMDFDFVVRLVQEGYKGYYISDKPVVKMEGTGISVKRELDSIKECYKSLIQNNFLNIKNFFWIMIRVVFFLLRKLMIILGADSLLRILKKKKTFSKKNHRNVESLRGKYIYYHTIKPTDQCCKICSN